MKNIHTPTVDMWYWAAIALASVFGTNLGDLYAHTLRLGLPAGLALLASIAAAIVFAERADGHGRTAYYWALIVVLRTGATNIADFLAFRLRVPPLLLSGGLAALLASLAFLAVRVRGAESTRAGASSLPDTNAMYWGAMLTAGVFGTVVGDVCSKHVGLGAASLGLAALFGIALSGRRRLDAPGRAATVCAYWLTVAVARTAGTAIGDWLAENRSIPLGLPLSTLLTGLTFVAVSACSRQLDDTGRFNPPI